METVLANKIVQRSIHGPHMARTSLRQLDKDDTGFIGYKHFCKFLDEFNVTLAEEEIQRALKKYESKGDVSMKMFTAEFEELNVILKYACR